MLGVNDSGRVFENRQGTSIADGTKELRLRRNGRCLQPVRVEAVDGTYGSLRNDIFYSKFNNV